ncbi:hypothetical protein [Providencia huaxiensis]|uniref:hypothetical protein n=1 Tax=Providencia huaxiensis TaxID=2027290 RepID=UPI000C7F3A9D|nr:hypothetical protein [Providencia huaxiensis]AXH61296.1 hypothetical protein CYG50_04235 [Providencia huaxiensis]
MSKIKQLGLVSAISFEIGNQNPNQTINSIQLSAITQAANMICAAFEEKNLCDSCNDWPRGGCSSICSGYGKENNHA